jgi:structure-specific recognition protein 1
VRTVILSGVCRASARDRSANKFFAFGPNSVTSRSNMETFDNIYLDFSKQPGRCRFADSGMGWKATGGGDTYTLEKDKMLQSFWNKAARGYEVKIYSKDAGIVQLDGFVAEDLERLKKLFQQWFGVSLESREHSLRGWNWGKAEFGKAELSFNVQSRSAFEVPYSEILNTNLAGKSEVAVEFSLPGDGEETGTNGHLGGARAQGKKSGGARDQLMEMRFYIPGTTSAKSRKEANGDDENSEAASDGEDGEDVEEQNAANLFYETLVEKAEIGEIAGETYATFLDILHLTPRFVTHFVSFVLY